MRSSVASSCGTPILKFEKTPANAGSLRAALERALLLFVDRPRYAAVQQRGMHRDFSWRNAAAGYEKLYQESV